MPDAGRRWVGSCGVVGWGGELRNVVVGVCEAAVSTSRALGKECRGLEDVGVEDGC